MEFPAELIQHIRQAQQITVLTGAGISAESGVPTFRDAQRGLWAKFDPQELATPAAFASHPRLVWEWYTWRRELVSQAKPNPGHIALAQMARHVENLRLITQNVDGLHQLAGSPQVIELHGNINRTICSEEKCEVLQWEPVENPPPRCPQCGAYLRPDVVWFGEALPEGMLEAAWDATDNCQVFLSIGTSTWVEPAALLPFWAKENGAVVVEINTQPTPLTQQANFVLSGPSGIILPALVQAVWELPTGV
jgi:NAD-dependent deacetylase